MPRARAIVFVGIAALALAACGARPSSPAHPEPAPIAPSNAAPPPRDVDPPPPQTDPAPILGPLR